jgi:AcrR family transcriptional regulator
MVYPTVQTTQDPSLRADGAATRAAILEATLRRLVKDGYARLNVRDIAEEAGVNHALINYHFGGKRQLVLAVLDAANRRLLERQQRMYGAETPASQKWRQACDFYADDLKSGFVRLMMELMAASYADEALRREFVPRLLAWHRLIDEAVEQTLARHHLELPIPPRAIGAWIACFFIGMEAEMTVGIDESEGHFGEAMQAMLTVLRLVESRPSPPTPKRATTTRATSRTRTRPGPGGGHRPRRRPA